MYDRFNRSFQRAQYAYDNAMPPDGPDPCEEHEGGNCDCHEQAREDAAEAAAERRAEQAQEDSYYADREEW